MMIMMLMTMTITIMLMIKMPPARISVSLSPSSIAVAAIARVRESVRRSVGVVDVEGVSVTREPGTSLYYISHLDLDDE